MIDTAMVLVGYVFLGIWYLCLSRLVGLPMLIFDWWEGDRYCNASSNADAGLVIGLWPILATSYVLNFCIGYPLMWLFKGLGMIGNAICRRGR